MQILEHSIAVSYDTAGSMTKAELKPADLRRDPGNPGWFPLHLARKIISVCSPEQEKTKRFLLAPNIASHKTYLFEDGLELKAQTGTIGIPKAMINNKIYKGPVVSLKKSIDFEIVPLNC